MADIKHNENIYYDCTFSNLNNNGIPPIAQYSETRNSPILYSPQEYNLIIARWSLSTVFLPIFIPLIQNSIDDPNLTVYSVSLTYNGKVFQKYIEFIPQNQQATEPVAPVLRSPQIQDNSNGYYDIYNYQYWISLINLALSDCFDGLKALDGALAGTFAPTMSYDTSSQIAIFNCDADFYDGALATPVNIYFNQALGNLFPSFPFTIQSYDNTDGLIFEMITNVIQSNITVSNDFEWVNNLAIYQEWSSVSCWNPVRSIVLTTNTLPIVPNNEGNPSIYLNDILISNGTNNNNTAQVLSDFCTDGIYRPSVLYVPTGEYRRIEMVGASPIYTIDISCYYKNNINQLIPIRLTAGGSLSVKFLFELKSKK